MGEGGIKNGPKNSDVFYAGPRVESNLHFKWKDFLPHFIWPWVKKRPASDLRLASFMQNLDQFFIIHKMQFVFLCSFLVYIFADLIACKPDARHKQCEKYVKNVFMHSPIRVRSRFEFQVGHSNQTPCWSVLEFWKIKLIKLDF